MPVLNGFDTALRFSADHPHSKMIFFTSHTNRIFIEKAIQCHCTGFLSKDSDVDLIRDAILEAKLTGFYHNDFFNPNRVQKILNEEMLLHLSVREKDFLRLLYMGKTTDEIAHEMNVKTETLYNYKNRIKTKLGFRTKSDFEQFVLSN